MLVQAAALFKVLKESPPIPDTLSAEGRDFLQRCFRRNPAERPTASELLDHPFVKCSFQFDATIHPKRLDWRQSWMHAITQVLALGEQIDQEGKNRYVKLRCDFSFTNEFHSSAMISPGSCRKTFCLLFNSRGLWPHQAWDVVLILHSSFTFSQWKLESSKSPHIYFLQCGIPHEMSSWHS